MKFEFAKATDITEFAKKYNDLYEGYEKVFIVPDTTDFHILRVLKDYGDGYEKAEGYWILEHQMIPKPRRIEIRSNSDLRQVLEYDDGGNYDYTVRRSLEECIEAVDGGFGINR